MSRNANGGLYTSKKWQVPFCFVDFLTRRKRARVARGRRGATRQNGTEKKRPREEEVSKKREFEWNKYFGLYARDAYTHDTRTTPLNKPLRHTKTQHILLIDVYLLSQAVCGEALLCSALPRRPGKQLTTTPALSSVTARYFNPPWPYSS